MAAIPKSLAEAGRRSSSSSHKGALSHGRGGAGNMGISPLDSLPITLDTPTIKSEVYTTGRGGSGNMTKNTDPEAARRAQDVVGVPRRESNSSTHVGRGGAANVFHPCGDRGSGWEHAVEEEKFAGGGGDGKHKGLADVGKEWLFGKK